ncbi:hypothetical protein [Vagococcus humatus]|uniref:Oligosaccharide repeat unit polymerase n=1 Tax=Vagococcus humatus TaxID=1889241 RepID=A0A3R9YF98_9ENTE|nr:hypothetical protein [Vagococcus humatus]RST89843.1 hypothetical protein C7P63_01830 [Vagococcus humatus]
MEKQIRLNPFNIQFAAILVVLMIYSLGWSDITKPLTWSTFLFFVFVLFNLAIFSTLYNAYFPEHKIRKTTYEGSMTAWCVLGGLAMLAEFSYEKAIPIYEIFILKNGYNYVNFQGIPGFHVFAVTYTSFLGLWLWQQFLSKKRWYQLGLAILFVSYPLMLFNRGGFIFNMVSAFFIWLYQTRYFYLQLKHLVILVLVLLGLSYGFGIFGNYRSFGASKNGAKKEFFTESTYILNTGKATREFKDSSVPKEFFWTYLYVATPVANLQNIIEKTEPMNDSVSFLTQSILPDFIGKRVDKKRQVTIPKDKLVSPVFNVSTYFSSAFKTLGYTGLILLLYYFALFIFGFTYLYWKFSGVQLVGLGILMTLASFSLFDNMLTFSGLSFQLIFPVLFGVYERL